MIVVLDKEGVPAQVMLKIRKTIIKEGNDWKNATFHLLLLYLVLGIPLTGRSQFLHLLHTCVVGKQPGRELEKRSKELIALLRHTEDPTESLI